MKKIGFVGTMLILLVGLIMSIPLCAFWGSADISYMETAEFLVDKLIPGMEYAGPSYMNSIIWQLRIPRIILGIAVGGGLSICGVYMQALTKNMLAEPYILGVSSGASALAVFVIAFGSGSFLGRLGVPGAAFLGAFCSFILVYLLSITGGKSSASRLLLSGVAVSMIFSSLTQFFLMLAPSGSTKNAIYWMMGSLASARWSNVVISVAVSILGFALSIILAPVLNVLSLGDDTATTMGVNVKRTRQLLLVIVSLMTGALVSASGCIGFVGLMIPHISRMLFGADHRRVTISSYLLGGIFLTWMDVLARTLMSPAEISIGILTAFCGGPFFIWLMRRKREGL